VERKNVRRIFRLKSSRDNSDMFLTIQGMLREFESDAIFSAKRFAVFDWVA
jgi:hypothetical protein